ncbi:hypothetical protein [Companilactobacillus mishanensis]|uniref:hypothetical protein n=1 Tax=Companilactobacillus mishanensis TaxID=2486008 RepID=UPI0012973985|nr:hypothetical protein [Companilactobacillus mishanensis]MQS89628.1 hypothetical protein [Companilactobacillus mishanensis]
MKNNIKYAGITAAALLAVAPIAAPVLTTTNTQVAQAATKAADLTADQKKSVGVLFDNMKDHNYSKASDVPTFSAISNNYNKNLDYDTFAGFPFIKDITGTALYADDAKNIKDGGVTFTMTGYKNGAVQKNVSDFNLSVGDLQKGSSPMSIQITAFDANGNQVNQKVITFTNSNQVTEAPTALNLTFTDPMNVAVNSSTSAPKYSTSVDPTIEDQNGNDIEIASSKVSQTLYTTKTDALNNTDKNTFTDSTFKNAGNVYYQAVTVTPKDSLVGSISDGMGSGKDGYTITLNGQQAIAKNYDASSNTLTYVRSIVVGNAVTDAEWVTTPSKGVVTVKSSLAHLYNDDNKMTTRSLAPASGWQTDSYRTNSKTGQKQWHVSTHEWVNDTDVTFEDGTVTGDGLGNFQNFDMKILTLDGPAGFVYTLFKADGTNATRGLAGLTAWQTDRSATDAAGNTYYRVSTDEWVRMGSGVTVK